MIVLIIRNVIHIDELPKNVNIVYCTQGNFDIKKLTNLHLPRFDELKVDELLDFINTSNIYILVRLASLG